MKNITLFFLLLFTSVTFAQTLEITKGHIPDVFSVKSFFQEIALDGSLEVGDVIQILQNIKTYEVKIENLDLTKLPWTSYDKNIVEIFFELIGNIPGIQRSHALKKIPAPYEPMFVYPILPEPNIFESGNPIALDTYQSAIHDKFSIALLNKGVKLEAENPLLFPQLKALWKN